MINHDQYGDPSVHISGIFWPNTASITHTVFKKEFMFRSVSLKFPGVILTSRKYLCHSTKSCIWYHTTIHIRSKQGQPSSSRGPDFKNTKEKFQIPAILPPRYWENLFPCRNLFKKNQVAGLYDSKAALLLIQWYMVQWKSKAETHLHKSNGRRGRNGCNGYRRSCYHGKNICLDGLPTLKRE